MAKEGSGSEPPTKRKRKSEHGVYSYQERRQLEQSPFFYYQDHSRNQDDTPFHPLVQAIGTSPNFVIKLHAILLRSELDRIICWLPHGRAWKIVDTTLFEKNVLPTYFKQSSVASFYRQANGWGFRRIRKGSKEERGSFYNERFLRAMPFLVKKMKRIGGAKMVEDSNISHEPQLSAISKLLPVPGGLDQRSLDFLVLSSINQVVQEEGSTAKMPFIEDIEQKLIEQANLRMLAKASVPNSYSLKLDPSRMLIPQVNH